VSIVEKNVPDLGWREAAEVIGCGALLMMYVLFLLDSAFPDATILLKRNPAFPDSLYIILSEQSFHHLSWHYSYVAGSCKLKA